MRCKFCFNVEQIIVKQRYASLFFFIPTAFLVLQWQASWDFFKMTLKFYVLQWLIILLPIEAISTVAI